MSPPSGQPRTVAEASVWIAAYLDDLPASQRDALEALRSTIREAVPEAVDAVSYGMPAFRYRGRALVSYLAARAHCSLFPMGGGTIDAHRAELEGFSLSKGTIRFTPEHRLPDDLVATIARERRAQIDAALEKPAREAMRGPPTAGP